MKHQAQENSRFNFDSVRLRPDEQIGLHVNRDQLWELAWVVVGSGIRTIGEESEPFAAGEVVLIPPGIPHCWSFNADDTDADGCIANFCLSFRTELLDALAALFTEFSLVRERLVPLREAVKFGAHSAQRIKELLREMGELPPARRVAPLLTLLQEMADATDCRTVGTMAHRSPQERRLRQVEIYVNCNAARRITLEDVARHVGMSRSSFCVFFRRATGRTFTDFLTDYRVRFARRLMQDEGLTVGEACFRSGFQSRSYFVRAFRRYLGAPPSAFVGGKGEN